MGYCVSLRNYDFTIRNQNKQAALEALHKYEREEATRNKFYRIGEQFDTLEDQLEDWFLHRHGRRGWLRLALLLRWRALQ